MCVDFPFPFLFLFLFLSLVSMLRVLRNSMQFSVGMEDTLTTTAAVAEHFPSDLRTGSRQVLGLLKDNNQEAVYKYTRAPMRSWG